MQSIYRNKMPELIVDILAGAGVIVLSLIWYFYLYPALHPKSRFSPTLGAE